MWIKFGLDGMAFELKIKNYISNQDWDGKWNKTSYNFCFQDIIKYSGEDVELLLNCEVDIIRNCMENLLNDRLDTDDEYECIEPDFHFIFKTKRYIGDIPVNENTAFANVFIDIGMDLQVNLWNGGLTANYFSMTFDRKEIEQFYLYLSLITKKIGIEDYRIKKLIASGVIYEDVE